MSRLQAKRILDELEASIQSQEGSSYEQRNFALLRRKLKVDPVSASSYGLVFPQVS